MQICIILTIAVSLSMDAFSLSIAYGTLGITKKEISRLSLIVGLYHFFMPLFGYYLGRILLNIIPLNPDFIVFVVLSFVGIEMIIESIKTESIVKKTKIIDLLLFGLAVSMDSFSIGIGLNAISHKKILCALTFSITSYIFTYLGLNFGKKINQLIGKISTIIGGVVLIAIGIIYLL